MRETPTWMATQAKVVVQYDEPFWRASDLSGRVASRIGPLVEIHDHCSDSATTAALFGFVGMTAAQRRQHRSALPSLVIEQLRRCFGKRANSPVDLWIEDWALSKTVCSRADLNTPVQHPQITVDSLRQPYMGGRLHFAGAEVSAESPGLIDGALHAGECAALAALQAI